MRGNLKYEESKLEGSICSLFRDNGYVVFKINGNNQRGAPDRVFLKNGRLVFMEFKARGGRLSKHQKHYWDLLIKQGFRYEIVKTYEHGVSILKELESNGKT